MLCSCRRTLNGSTHDGHAEGRFAGVFDRNTPSGGAERAAATDATGAGWTAGRRRTTDPRRTTAAEPGTAGRAAQQWRRRAADTASSESGTEAAAWSAEPT